MYTHKEDVSLREILNNMHDKSKGEIGPEHNSASAQEIKDFVDSVVADLDHDRIYNSDLKKLVQWYNILLMKNALPLAEEEEGTEKGSDAEKEKKDE